jgi:hypothetical protein
MVRRVQRARDHDHEPNFPASVLSSFSRGNVADCDRDGGVGRRGPSRSIFARQKSAVARPARATDCAIATNASRRSGLVAALSARVAGWLHHDRVLDRARAASTRPARRPSDRDVCVAWMAGASSGQARVRARASAAMRRKAANRQLPQRTHDRCDSFGVDDSVCPPPARLDLAAARDCPCDDCANDDGCVSRHLRRALGHRRRRWLAARRRRRSCLQRRARRCSWRRGAQDQGTGNETASIVPPWPSGTTDVLSRSRSSRFP